MDMALEMGNSVASLGSATAATASFCVVPPGKSSYMASSSMWASGILGRAGGDGNNGGNAHQQQQVKQQVRPSLQQGMAGVRSRANHLQSFLGGNRQQPSTQQSHSPAVEAKAAASPPPSHQQGLQITPGNTSLDQSWWGGGQGSILASSAISAAAASNSQRSLPPNSSGSDNQSHRQQQTSTNAKQLMQLMDSLNRLGNENAQLMREVEDARAARAEAKAAKDMMAKFKAEYAQRFGKVKEALKRCPGPPPGAAAGDHPVANSAYMRSAVAVEVQKRDQAIKRLSADLKKERDECKKKDGALQKYEAFYREVKARSAEKARQRQLAEKQARQAQETKRQQQQQQQRP